MSLDVSSWLISWWCTPCSGGYAFFIFSNLEKKKEERWCKIYTIHQHGIFHELAMDHPVGWFLASAVDFTAVEFSTGWSWSVLINSPTRFLASSSPICGENHCHGAFHGLVMVYSILTLCFYNRGMLYGLVVNDSTNCSLEVNHLQAYPFDLNVLTSRVHPPINEKHKPQSSELKR